MECLERSKEFTSRYSTQPIAAEVVWYISPQLLQFNEAHLGEDSTLFIPPKSHSMPHTEHTVSQNYSLEFFKVAGKHISALIFGRPRPVRNEGAGSIQAAAHFWKQRTWTADVDHRQDPSAPSLNTKPPLAIKSS